MFSHEELVSYVSTSLSESSFSDSYSESYSEFPESEPQHNRNILQLSPTSRKSRRSIKKHLRDWSYHQFDSSEQAIYIGKNYPEHLDLYQNLSTTEREKFFVYAWLYRNGGVYLANSHKILSNPIKIFDEKKIELFLTEAGINKIPYFLAARAGSPALSYLIDNFQTVSLFDVLNRYEHFFIDKLRDYKVVNSIPTSYDFFNQLESLTGKDPSYVYGVIFVLILIFIVFLIVFHFKFQ